MTDQTETTDEHHDPMFVAVDQHPDVEEVDAKIATTDGELRMVAVFRADLRLPPGKMAAQAGHAFLTAWRQAEPGLAREYAESAQVKIVLEAPDLVALERIAAKAVRRGVPMALITDAARTVLPEPMVTVLGLGPMTKTDSNALTRGLNLLS